MAGASTCADNEVECGRSIYERNTLSKSTPTRSLLGKSTTAIIRIPHSDSKAKPIMKTGTRLLLLSVLAMPFIAQQAFTFTMSPGVGTTTYARAFRGSSPNIGVVNPGPRLQMAQVSEQEAKKGIDKVVTALKRDSAAKAELGTLDKVTTILGYGSPSPGLLAVRFNASFKKGGFGRSSVPLPFGLGQSEKTEGRGQMVGQVKASIDVKTGKVTSCSVFRDLGYGRAFNMKL